MGEHWHYLAKKAEEERGVISLTINSGSDASFIISDCASTGANSGGGYSPYHSYFAYDWDIDWGDGTGWHRYTKQASFTSETRLGIYYDQNNYSPNTVYTIKIKSHDNSNGWLSAFSMGWLPSTGSISMVQNNSKILEVNGVIDKKMLVRDNDFSNITADQSTLPDYEKYRTVGYCDRMFADCRNLKIGDNFYFANDITKVLGGSFEGMFASCYAITMGRKFNLPQTITEVVGIYNTSNNINRFSLFDFMFMESRDANLEMNNQFNLPPVALNEESSYDRMFFNCFNLKLNNKFCLPSNITNPKGNFCYRMFGNSRSITSGAIRFLSGWSNPTQQQIDSSSDFLYQTFAGCSSLSENITTNIPCIAITPNSDRNTFASTSCTFGAGVSSNWY